MATDEFLNGLSLSQLEYARDGTQRRITEMMEEEKVLLWEAALRQLTPNARVEGRAVSSRVQIRTNG